MRYLSSNILLENYFVLLKNVIKTTIVFQKASCNLTFIQPTYF